MKVEFGLPDLHILSLRKIFAQHPEIQKVVLYGSRAMGNFKNSSDIDLSVVAPTWKLENLLRLENEIDDLMMPYKVDISLLHFIDHPDLLEHIRDKGRDFYRKS